MLHKTFTLQPFLKPDKLHTMSFGAPSRFASCSLCVYCTARSRSLKVGPVLEMNSLSYSNKGKLENSEFESSF